MFDEREALARLGPIDHEAHADAPEEALVPVRGTHDLHACGRRAHQDSSFVRQLCRAKCNGRQGRLSIYLGTRMSDQKRPYRMTRRAELEEQTRRRITESTVALHEELGPARTSISAIAERAGVRRSTVYRHFPDEASLFSACSL